MQYPLNYEKFQDFIENATNNADPLAISKNYTTNTVELLTKMNKVFSLLGRKLIKNRIARIQKIHRRFLAASKFKC